MNRIFYRRPVQEVARDLLGCILRCRFENGSFVSGRIVETEAYPQDDVASHSHRGENKRNQSMFMDGGHAYIYRIYGKHRCFNVVTGRSGDGAAVLIRALEPLDGIRTMWINRYGRILSEPPEISGLHGLCSGPGKLCRAMNISVTMDDGSDLTGETGKGRLTISPGVPIADDQVGLSRRIGLSSGRGDRHLRRWFITDSEFLSRKNVL